MSRKNGTHIYVRPHLENELQRVREEVKKRTDKDITLAQASIIVAERSKKVKMEIDDVWELLGRES